MVTERRSFLKLGAALVVLSRSAVAGVDTKESAAARWASCRAGQNRDFYFTLFDASGTPRDEIRLPGRGHSAVPRPHSDEWIVLSRRPGSYIWVVHSVDATVVQRTACPGDRHLYGHGVFDPSGRWLYLTENHYEAGEGVVGVYDAGDRYRRVGEFPSYGVGPHQLGALKDGRTLVVANGGVHTHPDTGRVPLNLDEMKPNLAYLDVFDGRLMEAYELPTTLRWLSIRHLDVTKRDGVCIAMQWKGTGNARPPLVAYHCGSDCFEWFDAPQATIRTMRNYCGSVCCDRSGRWCMVTAPRGNLAAAWSISDRQFVGAIQVDDVCGVAPGMGDGVFLLSGGVGDLLKVRADAEGLTVLRRTRTPNALWDNHLSLNLSRSLFS